MEKHKTIINPFTGNLQKVIDRINIYDKSNKVTTTTSDIIFIDKLELTAEIKPGISRECIIEWSFTVYNTTTNAIEVILLMNDETIAESYCYISGGSNNLYRLISGFLKEDIENGDIFKIQFRRDIGGIAKIKQVHLLLRSID